MGGLKIIFMGTPEFAIPSLAKLLNTNYNIVAVITAPDRPKGRGRSLSPSPVKEFALKHKLNVLQPTNLKSPEFIEELKALHADLQVVVAFRMLPEMVWSMPEKGTFNLHASLLPQYRGAAPINWAIINGEQLTGLTTFFIKQEIDTGNIIDQVEVEIMPEDNAGSLHDKLMLKGADLVLKTVRNIEANNIVLRNQGDEAELKKAPKIFKEMCEIDWAKPAKEVNNLIRGLSPYPGAFTFFNHKNYKITNASIHLENAVNGKPGSFVVEDNCKLIVNCLSGSISIDELQPEGRKRMKTEDFLRGNKI